MEVSVKSLAISSAAILLVGLAVGRFSLPAKVVTKTEIQVVTKEVESKTSDQEIARKSNKDFVRIVTKKPDGTVITETHIIDKSTSKTTEVTQDTTEKDSSTTITQDKTVTYAKNDWHVSGLASPSGDNSFLRGPSIAYGLMVERRILGPFYIGGFGLTNHTIGASLGVTF